jgi:alpha/beta hydrolase family protein
VWGIVGGTAPVVDVINQPYSVGTASRLQGTRQLVGPGGRYRSLSHCPRAEGEPIADAAGELAIEATSEPVCVLRALPDMRVDSGGQHAGSGPHAAGSWWPRLCCRASLHHRPPSAWVGCMSSRVRVSQTSCSSPSVSTCRWAHPVSRDAGRCWTATTRFSLTLWPSSRKHGGYGDADYEAGPACSPAASTPAHEGRRVTETSRSPGSIRLMSRFLQVNGLRMHVLDEGSGPFVLLLQGFPELSSTWRYQLRAFADAGYREVAPDQRGYGLTDCPERVDAYTIFHLVGDVIGLLDALGEARAVVVGHDWGAPVAWNTALLRPDRRRDGGSKEAERLYGRRHVGAATNGATLGPGCWASQAGSGPLCVRGP